MGPYALDRLGYRVSRFRGGALFELQSTSTPVPRANLFYINEVGY